MRTKKRRRRQAVRQPNPSSSATTFPGVPTGSTLPPVKNASIVGSNIDMRQRALALGRPRDDHPRFWRPIAAVKHGVAFDRRRPGIIFDQLGHRSEEHTSELQSLMRISYAVFCLT